MPPKDPGAIDYENIKIPDGKDPKEYHYTERRAEILQLVKDRGNPYSVKRASLARHYGVDPAQITRDFQRLSESLEGKIGTDAKLTARYAMEKAVKELQDAGEYASAFSVAMEWNRWLQSIGEQERVAFEAEVTHREAALATDDYVVIPDDEADALVDLQDAQADAEESPSELPSGEIESDE